MDERLLDGIRRLLRPLAVRVANIIARGVVQLVDDKTKIQLLQIGELEGGPLDECERFQSYGYASVPLPGAEAVLICPNGDRAHPLVVAVDDRRYRPTDGNPGEVVIYTHEGDEVRLAEGRLIAIKTGGRVEIRDETGAALAETDELVHGSGIDPFTGSPYKALGNTTSKVRARK